MKNILAAILMISFNSFSQTYEVKTETKGSNYNAYTGQGVTTSTSTIIVKKDPNQEIVEMSKNFANSFKIAAKNGAFKTASQKCEDIISIPSNINKYKYLFVRSITASKEKEVVAIKKTIYEELKSTNWIILDTLSVIPDDLKINPNLALFLTLDSENVGWPFRIVGLTLFDYKENIIHQRVVRHDRSAEFLAELTLKSLKNYPYTFNNGLVDKELISEEELKKITKSEALIKLKEAKELLDLKVITIEEYELLVLRLKPKLIEK